MPSATTTSTNYFVSTSMAVAPLAWKTPLRVPAGEVNKVIVKNGFGASTVFLGILPFYHHFIVSSQIKDITRTVARAPYLNIEYFYSRESHIFSVEGAHNVSSNYFHGSNQIKEKPNTGRAQQCRV